MLKLNIDCQDNQEAMVYLNAPQYLAIITDLTQAIRNAEKHGSDESLLIVVREFYPDLCRAVDHVEGAY